MNTNSQNDDLTLNAAARAIISGNVDNVRAGPNVILGSGNRRRQAGTSNTVHVDGWDELRWILQLGPHLLAAAVNQDHLPMASEIDRSPDSIRQLEASKRRRQEFVHKSVIHKKVKESKSTQLYTAEEKSDMYVSSITSVAKTKETDQRADPKLEDAGTCHIDTTNDKNTIHDETGANGNTTDGYSGENHFSSPCCAICLKSYTVDDAICWSRNPKCSHHFHCSCIEIWLLRNDNCPMCREPYLDTHHHEDANHDGYSEVEDRVPPLRPEEIENLELGVVDPNQVNSSSANTMEAAELMEVMAGIERLYRQANDRLFLQTNSGHNFQITISRPDSPTISDIEAEIFPPTG